MCSVLQARGVPAASMLVLGPAATNLLAATVVVETPAPQGPVRQPSAERLRTHGHGQLRLRAGAADCASRSRTDGAAAYRAALHQDVAARAAAGTQLLANKRIQVTARARMQLAGRPGRFPATDLASRSWPRCTRSTSWTSVIVARVRAGESRCARPTCSGSSRTAGMTDADYLNWIVALARAQLVPFAGSITALAARRPARRTCAVLHALQPLDLLTSSWRGAGLGGRPGRNGGLAPIRARRTGHLLA